MNRKKLIIGVIIGVLIVLISVVVFLTPQDNPQQGENQLSPTPRTYQGNAAPPLNYEEFLRSPRSQICTFAVTSETQNIRGAIIPSQVDTGTIYAANGKIKGQFTMTTKDGTFQQHVLVDAYTAYLWSNLNNGGVKFLVGEKPEDEIFKQPLTFDCKDWTPNNAVFDIPANIVFTEITDFSPESQTAQ